jgi:transposase
MSLDSENPGSFLQFTRLLGYALSPRPRGRPKMPPDKKTPPPSTEGAKRTREEELQAENDQLRMENAYLKKLRALIQAQQKATLAKKRK